MHNPVPNPLGLLHNDADTLLAQQVFGRRVLSSSSSSTSSVVNLDDLGDVVITSPATGSFLQYNGSQWIDFDLLAAGNTWGAQNTFTNGVILASTSVVNAGVQLRFQNGNQRIFGTSPQLDIVCDAASSVLNLTSNGTGGVINLTCTDNIDFIVGTSGIYVRFESSLVNGTYYPTLTPVAEDTSNIMLQKGGIFLMAGVGTNPAIYFANSGFTEYCYLIYSDTANTLTFNSDSINETTIVFSRHAGMRLALYGRANATAGNRRGGEIQWYHGTSGGNTVRGYMFVNDGNQLVFDSSEQSTNTDQGLAFIDFDDGAASFASVTSTSLSTASRILYTATGGLFTYSGNLTFSGSTLTVTGSASITSNLAVGGVLQDGTGQNAIELFDTGSANYLRFCNAATGNPIIFKATGSDTNVAMHFWTKGVSAYSFADGGGTSVCTMSPTSSGVNYLTIAQAASGNAVTVGCQGEANVNLTVQSLGTGILTLGTSVKCLQPTLGSAVLQLVSTATNDDPTETVYQNRVATTDATLTTLHTFTVPSNTTYVIESTVVARRTGGVSGAAEDGAGYQIIATYKNVAGTATLIGSVTTLHSAESQVGWACTYNLSGATVLLQVTGAASNNVTWHSTSRVWAVNS